MSASTLYDLSPLWRLMALGAAVALLPLAWVRWRHPAPGQRLRALSLLTLFLTFDLVMFGAFTRLTDSGLGCPDWPGCYGQASPLGAGTQISVAQAAMPTGPVTQGKAWIEMLHRYLAMAVGVLIIGLALWQWRKHRSGEQALSPWWATATLLWVCLQGAFGALTVTMKLFPAIVTLHLLGGLVLLALLAVQAVGLAQVNRPQATTPGLRGLIWAALAVVALQSALGAWVSTNYAVLACTDFPKCQGNWWPLMDFSQGFTLWRELGMTADGKFLGFEALTAIHYTHRLFAVLVLVIVGALVPRLWRLPALHRQARWLAVIIVLQLVTGLSNVVLDWPLLSAVLHTGGAAALVAVLVWCLGSSLVGPQGRRA